MIKHMLLPGAAILATMVGAPAFAQQNDRALVVYGSDPLSLIHI